MPDATRPPREARGSDRGRLVAFPGGHPDASPPSNLPLQLRSFVGREKELAEVKQLLEDNRLLTLTGSGGCGKTRLAVVVAGELVEGFEDGVWMAELASLAHPSLVPQAVASTLDVRERPLAHRDPLGPPRIQEGATASGQLRASGQSVRQPCRGAAAFVP